MNVEFAEAVAKARKLDIDEAARAIVQLSIITHILQPELVAMMAEAAGEENLLPPSPDAKAKYVELRTAAARTLQPSQARGPRRGAQPHRGQPSPRRQRGEEVHRPRHVPARPHPGRQHRPHPRCREVRLPQGLQVQHLRHLVDSPGHHSCHRRPGPDHPHPGPHGRDDQQAGARQPPSRSGVRP